MKTVCLLVLAACISGTSSFGKRQDAASPAPPVSTTDMATPPPPTSSANDVNDTTGGLVPDENCLDKRDDCRRFGVAGCEGSYMPWAKANCPRYCKFCIHPNDTIVECVNNIDNCDQYQTDMCTNPKYRLFAEDNCKLYCNLCNAGPHPVVVGSSTDAPSTPELTTASTTSDNDTCVDTVDYCWGEPDENCFGIFEPWAKSHCPFRCGFCKQKPPCVDDINYCSQFDLNSCNSDEYIGWFRQHCRKSCNLCALPTRPPTQVSVVTDASGNTVAVQPPTHSPQQPNRPNSTDMSGSFGPAVGASFLGSKRTYIIQGPPSKTPGTCLYKGQNHLQDKNWYDGCDYVCNCFDAKLNRIICTDRCNKWGNLPSELTGCAVVQEASDCCPRLECNM